MAQRTAILRGLAGMCLLFLMAAATPAADPGIIPPANSEVSDQKLGSVLIFPYYTSSSSSPNLLNTRIAITNHSETNNVTLHLFFVSGSSGSVADSIFCLTTVQTANFLLSDVDPDVPGFLVAVAVNTSTGVPINFNNLSGEADVKLSTGHRASYKAEAIAAISLPAFGGGLPATLNFDGIAYNRMPRTVAMNKIRSRLDGNSPVLILTRVTGNYATGTADGIGAFSGNLYDDASNAAPFTGNISSPQTVQALTNSFPQSSPPLDTMIPAGRTGWLHVAKTTDVGLFGVLLNFNPNSATSASAFTGGHNLRFVTLSTSNSIIIPTMPPACGGF